MPKKACLAIVLVNPREPQYAGSYHWCMLDEHDREELHECYCGISWTTSEDDLVPPTEQMIQWRTGDRRAVKRVRGQLMG